MPARNQRILGGDRARLTGGRRMNDWEELSIPRNPKYDALAPAPQPPRMLLEDADVQPSSAVLLDQTPGWWAPQNCFSSKSQAR